MKPIHLLSWAAWSPGLTDEREWREWVRSPTAIESEGAPDVQFVPAMLRRRCDPLSRMMLHVANTCCTPEQLESLPTVFASRHGSFEMRGEMLFALAREEALSPASFSHSVHNVQSGLFSIWARNRAASTSLTAGEDTFAHGFLEAVACLARSGAGQVLYIVGDRAIPPSRQWLAEQPPGSYALALLLGRDPIESQSPSGFAPATETPESTHPPLRLELELTASQGALARGALARGELASAEPATQEHDAIRFVAWLFSERKTLRIDHGRLGWVFRR